MSGHSKWSTIKHKKGAEDAKRGKIFTKHAKLIAIAARFGGDPDMNPALRSAIDNARAVNMPRDNIERAIKKGTGESKDGVVMEEIMYEGFAPGGVALYIEALTDNKNRTVTNIKTVLNKYGGNLGAAGSVGYFFKKHGLITLDKIGTSMEEIELQAIDAGAEDIREEADVVFVSTQPHDVMKVKKALEERGIAVKSAELTYSASSTVDVPDAEIAKKVEAIIEKLEEDEDISCVYTNFSGTPPSDA